MFLRVRPILFCATALIVSIGRSDAEVKDLPREGFDFFEKNIRPVLVEKCYKCHSAQSEKLKGSLLLDSKQGMLKGGSTGPALVPFKPDDSLLLKAIRYTDPDLQMPPKEKLSDFEIKNFEIWIKLGAPDPRKESTDEKKYARWTLEEAKEFWSFKPIGNPTVPKVKNSKWARNAIDSFVLARLEEKNLGPVSPADKRTLLRRATFDLTGLPPTPEEVENFVKDRSPQAFEKVVDRLLASPHYGEQWGRHWLDVVRYADTSGCNSDFPVPTAYKYRNYVVNAFNGDKPYDQFLREQIAGDLLPSNGDRERFEKIIATGYLAISRRFGSRNNEFHLTIEDSIDTLGKGILGLSVGCARCHDHKFDPIPTADYYGLYGIFQSTKYAFPGTEVYRHPKDFVPLAGGADMDLVVKYQTELAALDDQLEELGEERRALDARIEENMEQEARTASADEKVKLLQEREMFENKVTVLRQKIEERKKRQKELEANPLSIEKAYAVSEGKPGNARIQKKGSPFNLGEEVPRGFLKILGGQTLPPTEQGSGRLELAQWLTDPANPLTARVMVNRIWQHHIGKAIVPTPNDFGSRGKPPTHPELLDYLARQFIQNGWSIKQMHKLIMLSATYQLSADDNVKNAAVDPENQLVWRFNRHRLSAEEIRDSILFVSATLDPSMGGPHPFPPETEWKFSQHKPFVAAYDTNRRSVYLMQQRIRKQPFLDVWDGADPNATTAERRLTTSPIQALFLMNSELMYQAAAKFVERLSGISSSTSKRVEAAVPMVYGRMAGRDDVAQAIQYLHDSRTELLRTGAGQDEALREAWASYARVLFSSNEFLFVE